MSIRALDSYTIQAFITSYDKFKDNPEFKKDKSLCELLIEILSYDSDFFDKINERSFRVETDKLINQKFYNQLKSLEHAIFNNNLTIKFYYTIVDDIFLILYIHIYELSITTDTKDTYYQKYIDLLNELTPYIKTMDDTVYTEIIRCSQLIPKIVYDNYMNHNNKIQDFLTNTEKHIQELSKIKDDCTSIEEKISLSKIELEEQRQEFNFIGLSNAFQKMKNDKQEELKNEKTWNNFLQIIIVLLLFSKILIAVSDRFNDFSAGFVMTSISMILFIAVVIYFFRISLINIKSIKSQILQLDLRLSLCQFIHNYAEDSEKMRSENMKDSLDRFESIIFSPIVANEEQIPTTFDNLDQFIKVMNLVNGAKSGSNQTNDSKQKESK